MATKTKLILSNTPVPPGRILSEEIEDRGITLRELAERTGQPVDLMDDMLSGETAITPAVADELEKVLGIPAQFWLNLETVYRLTLAENSVNV